MQSNRKPRRKSDPRKQSLYFTAADIEQIYLEAQRLQRSASWVVRQAWRMSRERIAQLQAIED